MQAKHYHYISWYAIAKVSCAPHLKLFHKNRGWNKQLSARAFLRVLGRWLLRVSAAAYAFLPTWLLAPSFKMLRKMAYSHRNHYPKTVRADVLMLYSVQMLIGLRTC